MTATPPTRKRPGKSPPPAPPDPNDTLGLRVAEREDLEAQVLYRLHLSPRAVTLGELCEGYRPRWAAEALARCEAKGLVTAVRKGRDEAAETRWSVTFEGLVELYTTCTVDIRGVRRPLAPVF